jgi:hypothetical protein
MAFQECKRVLRPLCNSCYISSTIGYSAEPPLRSPSAEEVVATENTKNRTKRLVGHAADTTCLQPELRFFTRDRQLSQFKGGRVHFPLGTASS